MTPFLPRPRAILFDWDNTLVDTWPVIHAALAETFEAAKMPVWSLEEVKAKVRKSMRDSFPEIFGEDWQSYGDLYQSAYRKRQSANAIQPLHHAHELVHFLAGLPLFVGIVSNKKGPGLRIEAENLGWTKLFGVLVGADDAARDKPHADPVTLALKDSQIAPGPDVWFVGDSEIDLECAKNCGLTPIYYGPDATAEMIAEQHYGGFPFAAHVAGHEALKALIAAHLT